MSKPLTDEQAQAFHRDGLIVLRNFYDTACEVEPIQRAIHSVIGLLIAERGLAIRQAAFSPATFDSGYQELIALDRSLGGIVYDAVKQIPAFVRLVANERHEATVQQLRNTAQAGIAAGGYGIRIDNPNEEKFRAAWHQDYPAQFRSLDGLVFWSPLAAVTQEMGPVEFCIGSHKDGLAPIRMRDARNPDKTGAYGLTLDGEAERVARYEKTAPLTNPGDLVVIDFLTLHCSGENLADRSRWSMQMRWFNFEEATGRRIAWAGSFAAGNDLRAVHPELVID
jgi:ectoine hydroxylase-related dioxygenase (phytanoyl-CoA dioxygenase family)